MFAQQSLQLSRRRYASVSYALQNNSLQKRIELSQCQWYAPGRVRCCYRLGGGAERSCRLTEFKQSMTAKQGHYQRRQLKPHIPSWAELKRSHLASVQIWTWQESAFLWTVQWIAVVSAIFSSVYWEIFGSRINSVLIIVDWPRIHGLTIG